eukprot:CFRG3626T1
MLRTLGVRPIVRDRVLCVAFRVCSSASSPPLTSSVGTPIGKVCSYLTEKPQIHPSCFVAPSASVMGRVQVGQNSSVFYNCTLRADINHITIGERTNIQDNTVIHVSTPKGTTIGNGVTIGHNAIIHACDIEDNVLIGMGAIVMDGAVVGRDSVVAAGSLIPAGDVYPEKSLIMGSPARFSRELADDEVENLRSQSAKYMAVMSDHKTFNEQK